MLDPQNLIHLSGGMIADPEMVADGKIMKFRIGVDYAASDKDSDNNSGYFDVIYYLKDGSNFASKNASFVAGQINEGKMKKGSSVAIIGRLVQERWKQDDQNRSRVVVVAEHISYTKGSGAKKDGDSSGSSSAEKPAPNQNIPSSF
jgi:hypothetical protein